jgi:hypothetical protein
VRNSRLSGRGASAVAAWSGLSGRAIGGNWGWHGQTAVGGTQLREFRYIRDGGALFLRTIQEFTETASGIA